MNKCAFFLGAGSLNPPTLKDDDDALFLLLFFGSVIFFDEKSRYEIYMSTTPSNAVAANDNDGIVFLGQSYAMVSTMAPDLSTASYYEDENYAENVRVAASVEFHPDAKCDEEGIFKVRVDSVFSETTIDKGDKNYFDGKKPGCWIRPIDNVAWVEIKFPMWFVLEEIERKGLSGATGEDVLESIREGMRKRECEFRVNHSGKIPNRRELFEKWNNDSIVKHIKRIFCDVWFEIECVIKGHSKPFTLELPPRALIDEADYFVGLVNENEGGSVGLSKFAQRAMKEVEELREIVRKGSVSNEGARKDDTASRKRRQTQPLEMKKVSPIKRRAMGGGYANIKK